MLVFRIAVSGLGIFQLTLAQVVILAHVFLFLVETKQVCACNIICELPN